MSLESISSVPGIKSVFEERLPLSYGGDLSVERNPIVSRGIQCVGEFACNQADIFRRLEKHFLHL